jgi:hypothetical protein
MVNFFSNSIHSSQNIYTTRDHELVNRVRLGLKYIPLRVPNATFIDEN